MCDSPKCPKASQWSQEGPSCEKWWVSSAFVAFSTVESHIVACYTVESYIADYYNVESHIVAC